METLKAVALMAGIAAGIATVTLSLIAAVKALLPPRKDFFVDVNKGLMAQIAIASEDVPDKGTAISKKVLIYMIRVLRFNARAKGADLLVMRLAGLVLDGNPVELPSGFLTSDVSSDDDGHQVSVNLDKLPLDMGQRTLGLAEKNGVLSFPVDAHCPARNMKSDSGRCSLGSI